MYELDRLSVRRGAFTLQVEHCLLQRGATYAVVGPNGSGKTTFLELLALATTPAGGELSLAGEVVNWEDSNELLARRRRIAYLMQSPYLFSMTVADNIGFGMAVRGVAGDEARERVVQIARRLSLEPLLGRRAHRLSGGEAQRVALARTLVLDADAYLLDEPTAHVDRRHVALVEELIDEVGRRRNATVVLATHSSDQACRMSCNHLSLIDGRLAGMVYENVISGELREEEDGLRTVILDGGLVVRVAQGNRGPVTVAIDPEDIILSDQQLESSALNRFEGQVTRVETQEDRMLRVFVDVGSASLCALITPRSFEKMGLNVGRSTWVTFKATAVHVF